MLYYRNPKYDNFLNDVNGYNVIKFRQDDWNQIAPNIVEFFVKMCKLSGLSTIKSVKIKSVMSQSRHIIEDTLLDKTISITLETLKNKLHTYNITIPYLNHQCKICINGVNRFLIFQITDKSVVRRKNQIRLNNNIRQQIIHINRYPGTEPIPDKFNYDLIYQKHRIPLVLLLLTRMDILELEKATKTKIKFSSKPLDKISKLSELIQVNTTNCSPEIKLLFEDLSKINMDPEIIKKSNSKNYIIKYVDSLTDNKTVNEYLDEICELDVYFKRYLDFSSMELDILHRLQMNIQDISANSLYYKRVRIHEYIMAFIINSVYTQIYSHLKNLKPLVRNFNIQDLLPSNKFQEMFQLSKVEDNLVADISELLKCTITGPGGIPQDSVTQQDRNIHNSYYGIIDPILTPDGGKCGIVSYLTLPCPINPDGTFDFSQIYPKRG